RGRATRGPPVAPGRARPQALGRRREGRGQGHAATQRVGTADSALLRSMTLLSDAAVLAELEQTPGWTRVSKTLDRTYRFQSFREALVLVHGVAELAADGGPSPDRAVRGLVADVSRWARSP